MQPVRKKTIINAANTSTSKAVSCENRPRLVLSLKLVAGSFRQLRLNANELIFSKVSLMYSVPLISLLLKAGINLRKAQNRCSHLIGFDELYFHQ